MYLIQLAVDQEKSEHIIVKDGLRDEQQQQHAPDNDHMKVESDDFHLHYWHDPIVKRIEKRLARLTMFPDDYGEQSVITKFTAGQEETIDADGVDETLYEYKNGTTAYDAIARKGQHVATVIIYLNDVEEGGHIVFPYAGRGEKEARKLKEREDFMSSHTHRKVCSMWNVMYVSPKRGDAIFFYDLDTDNTYSTATNYANCPVRKGSKWILKKRINITSKSTAYFFYII